MQLLTIILEVRFYAYISLYNKIKSSILELFNINIKKIIKSFLMIQNFIEHSGLQLLMCHYMSN